MMPGPRMTLETFKALRKGALVGFATVRLPNGLLIGDCPICTSHGKTWASLPSKPILDRDGRHVEEAARRNTRRSCNGRTARPPTDGLSPSWNWCEYSILPRWEVANDARPICRGQDSYIPVLRLGPDAEAAAYAAWLSRRNDQHRNRVGLVDDLA